MIEIIREEKDRSNCCYNYTIVAFEKIYFIESKRKVLFPNYIDEYEWEHSLINVPHISLLDVMDVIEINNRYYVGFSSLVGLIESIADSSLDVYNDLFMVLSGSLEDFSRKYLRMKTCMLFQQLYGYSNMSNVILTSKEEFGEQFSICTEGNYRFVIQLTVSPDLAEVYDVVIHGFHHDFFAVILDSDTHLSESFIDDKMTNEELNEIISLFYKDNHFYIPNNVVNKVLAENRRVKIKSLLKE